MCTRYNDNIARKRRVALSRLSGERTIITKNKQAECRFMSDNNIDHADNIILEIIC